MRKKSLAMRGFFRCAVRTKRSFEEDAETDRQDGRIVITGRDDLCLVVDRDLFVEELLHTGLGVETEIGLSAVT